MENGEAAVDLGGLQSPKIHWKSREITSPLSTQNPAIPALIKINQIPVGYSTSSNTNKNNSEPNPQSTPPPTPSTMPSTTVSAEAASEDMPPLHMAQYRPTVISLNTHIPVINTNSANNHKEDHTPLPRPLVPPPDGERPERMRDWLVRMINSGCIPGLLWLNEEKMIFRVPWIHAKKRDYNQERDAALFREWAIHSGKYGDGSDVTTWKINFRCALNGLKDIIERRELEEADCRVYQMLPSTSSGRRRKRRRVYYSTDAIGYASSDCRGHLDLSSPVTTPTFPLTPTTASVTPIQMLPIVTAGGQVHLPVMASPTTPHTTPTMSPFGLLQGLRPIAPSIFHPHPLPHTQFITNKSVSPTSKEGSNSLPPTPRTPLSPPQSVHPPTTTTKIFSSFPLSRCDPPSFAPSAAGHLSNSLRVGPIYCPPQEFCTSPSAVTIRILYGSITVHMDTIDCTPGTRIFYGPLHCRDVLPPEQEEKLFGPLKAHQIQLSPRHPASLSKEVFSAVKRGLILEIDNGCIFATALCRAVVYYGFSPVRHAGTLAKEEKTKVFNYAHRFLPSLKHTSEVHGAVPKPYVIFSLGQPWGAERPLSKNLVSIVVTYCRALNDIRVQGAPIHDELLFEAHEARDIRIISPTPSDVAAEQFLNPGDCGQSADSPH